MLVSGHQNFKRKELLPAILVPVIAVFYSLFCPVSFVSPTVSKQYFLLKTDCRVNHFALILQTC